MPKQAVVSSVRQEGKAVFAKKTTREPLKSGSVGGLWNPTAALVTLFWEWPSNATLQTEHSKLCEAESSAAHTAQIPEKRRCLEWLSGGS